MGALIRSQSLFNQVIIPTSKGDTMKEICKGGKWGCRMCWTLNPDSDLWCGGWRCGHFYTTGASSEDAHRLMRAELEEREKAKNVLIVLDGSIYERNQCLEATLRQWINEKLEMLDKRKDN